MSGRLSSIDGEEYTMAIPIANNNAIPPKTNDNVFFTPELSSFSDAFRV